MPSDRSRRFAVAHRLTRKVGFNHVIQASNISDECFKVFFVGNHENNARLGIVVSKKLLSNATDRNSVKRIIREVFRHNSIKARRLDLVVMLRRHRSSNHLQLARSLEMLLGRIENQCAKQ